MGWDTDLKVCVSLSIKMTKFMLILREVHQGSGGTNGTQGVMEASAGIPILCAIDPEIPHNDGCLRHITCEARKVQLSKLSIPLQLLWLPFVLRVRAGWYESAQAAPERSSAGYGGFHCPYFRGRQARRRGKGMGGYVFQ